MVQHGNPNDAHARLLLIGGVVSGLLLAAVGLLRSGSPVVGARDTALPQGTVAVVNGSPIAQDLYARLLGGLAEERKGQELEPADRQRVLERMIDEELLLQRGLELGLARTDQLIRRQIVAALTASISAEAEDISPDETELRRFYEEHTDFFARPGRLSFAQIFFRVSSSTEDALVRQRADQATNRLRAGEALEMVNQELGDEPVMRLPASPLPVEKIQEYVGPTATRTLLTLEPGQVSDPVRSGIGYHVLVLHAQQQAIIPPFEAIRQQVLAQYRRMVGEQAVAAYIAELRKRARIQISDE